MKENSVLIFEEDCKSSFGLSLSLLQQRDSLSFSATLSIASIIFHSDTPLPHAFTLPEVDIKRLYVLITSSALNSSPACFFLFPSMKVKQENLLCAFLYFCNYTPALHCSMICRFSQSTDCIDLFCPPSHSPHVFLYPLSSLHSTLSPSFFSNDLFADSETMKSYGISI